MNVDVVFLVKLIACAGLSGLIGLGQVWPGRWSRYLAGRENTALGWAFVLTRLLPFVAVYLVLGEMPRGDVPFFYDKAARALRGGLVYVDFWSYHAPLFAYILALPLVVWHDARAVVLLMLLVEGLTLWLTYRQARRRDADAAIRAALLYLLLPAPVVMCLLGGQEDVWLWLFGLLAMLVGGHVTGSTTEPGRASAVRLGLVLAAGLLVLKVTFVLIVFPVFWLVRSKSWFVGALLLVGLPTLAGLHALTGGKFLMPIQHSGLPFSPNLPSVLRPWLFGLLNGVSLKTLNLAGMLGTITLLSLTGYRYRHLALYQALPALWVVTFGVFQLFQASAMAYYVFIYLMPVVFWLMPLTNGWRLAGVLTLNWLVVVQPYVTIVNNQPLFTTPGLIGQGPNALVYLLDLATVLGLAWLVWLALRQLETLHRNRV